MTLADEVSAARKRIFRDGYDISFGELVSLYEKSELIIQPEYQRLFRWDQTQKTRFIESILLNIPIPPVFVFSDPKGRWELVDGLQRVSTVLEFMGKLRDADGNTVAPFTCDGTGLVPSLESIRWPVPDEEDQPEDRLTPEVLPLPFRLGIRRARIRVEILGQETDAHVKYELFQRLNSGGTNLSEQELRNCIVVSTPIRLTHTPARCRVIPVAGIKLGIGRRLCVASDAEQRTEGVERVEAAVEPKREFVEVGL